MTDDEKPVAIYDRLRLHHEHSDEMFTKYLTILVTFISAIIAAIAILILKYAESNANLTNLYFIFPLTGIGFYALYQVNEYLQNEKMHQKTLIDFYNDLKSKNNGNLLLEPDPHAVQKIEWSERGWSRIPSV